MHKLLEVELELLTLKNVTVNTAALARTGRDAGVQTTSAELGLKTVAELGARGTGSGAGGLADGLRGLALGRGRHTVVGLEELTERSSIDLNNGRLGQGVGTHKLVVGRVVDHRNDTGLARDTLGTPGEVTGFETKSTELLVTTPRADRVDTLGADLGVRRLTAGLELPLLAELSAHGAGVRALVTSVAADSHSGAWWKRKLLWEWLWVMGFFVKRPWNQGPLRLGGLPALRPGSMAWKLPMAEKLSRHVMKPKALLGVRGEISRVEAAELISQ